MHTLELTIPEWKPPKEDAFVLGKYYDADEATKIPQFIVDFGFKSPQEHFTYDYYIVGEEDEYDDSSKCLPVFDGFWWERGEQKTNLLK